MLACMIAAQIRKSSCVCVCVCVCVCACLQVASLTHNHDVELKALLHGLPSHLLQDGVDAHVAEIGAMLVPFALRRVGTGLVEVGRLGRLGHVAVTRVDL